MQETQFTMGQQLLDHGAHRPGDREPLADHHELVDAHADEEDDEWAVDLRRESTAKDVRHAGILGRGRGRPLRHPTIFDIGLELGSGADSERHDGEAVLFIERASFVVAPKCKQAQLCG